MPGHKDNMNNNSSRPQGQGGARRAPGKKFFGQKRRQTPEDRLMATLGQSDNASQARTQPRPNRGTSQQRPSRPYGRTQRPVKKTKGHGQYINPNRFINAAVSSATEVPYEPTHVFSDFQLSTRLHANVARKNYVKPSAIQDQAIQPMLDGRDVIGLANTGTGKTAAFLIPTIEKITYLDIRPSVLIITPTRELATQIDDEFRAFAHDMRLYSAVCVGGVQIGRQITAIKRRPHVIIGTPGRLKDLLQQKILRLDTINTLILDEADRMCDMGFLPDIKRIISQLPETKQNLFFSATMTPAIETLIKEMMNDPVTVSVRTSETAEHVDQNVVYARDRDHKYELLTNMLSDKEFEKVLVFGETKFGVQRLAQKLSDAGHTAEAIHGNKTQSQRQRSLDKFKTNHAKVLVATDVAARGLDIPNVSHVINFDQPHTYDDYVHRIGRTGRGGKSGKALTFVNER